MNIAFLLTPKSQVIWVRAHGSVEQALERMRPYGFSAVPMLDDMGKYVGTLTAADILWCLVDQTTNGKPVNRAFCKDAALAVVERRTNNRAVHIDGEIEALIVCAADQNFVPVVDDREVFIGIVTRKSIIERGLKLLEPAEGSSASAGTVGASNPIQLAVQLASALDGVPAEQEFQP